MGRFVLAPLLHLPASAVDRLKNQSKRNTPPYLVQSAILRSLRPKTPGLSKMPKFSDSLIRDLAKVELHALDAMDQAIEKVGQAPGWIQAHLNPSEVERTIKTNWVDVEVPGMSHPIIHYGGTKGQSVRLSLFFDAFLFAEAFGFQQKQHEKPLDFGVAEIRKAHRFLEACNYARALESDGPIDQAPPRIYFCWPNAFGLRCVLESVDFKYLEFASTGHITRFTADIVLKEIRDNRLNFEDVMAKGAIRFEAPSGTEVNDARVRATSNVA